MCRSSVPFALQHLGVSHRCSLCTPKGLLMACECSTPAGTSLTHWAANNRRILCTDFPRIKTLVEEHNIQYVRSRCSVEPHALQSSLSVCSVASPSRNFIAVVSTSHPGRWSSRTTVARHPKRFTIRYVSGWARLGWRCGGVECSGVVGERALANLGRVLLRAVSCLPIGPRAIMARKWYVRLTRPISRLDNNTHFLQSLVFLAVLYARCFVMQCATDTQPWHGNCAKLPHRVYYCVSASRFI